MNKTRLTIFVLVVSVILFSNKPVHAAMESHLSLAIDGNDIIGECLYAWAVGTTVVYAVGHNVHQTYDPATGQLTGSASHTPFQIFKAVDKTSPMLNKALVNREPITKFVLKFYRPGLVENVEHYYTIQLANAYIVKITPSLPPTFAEENGQYQFMETVSFIYQTITWTSEVGGVTHSSNW